MSSMHGECGIDGGWSDVYGRADRAGCQAISFENAAIRKAPPTKFGPKNQNERSSDHGNSNE